MRGSSIHSYAVTQNIQCTVKLGGEGGWQSRCQSAWAWKYLQIDALKVSRDGANKLNRTKQKPIYVRNFYSFHCHKCTIIQTAISAFFIFVRQLCGNICLHTNIGSRHSTHNSIDGFANSVQCDTIQYDTI